MRTAESQRTGVRVIIFRDGTARCTDCKGFGLVRARGPRAGEHYKSFSGAQTALSNGNARDCLVCAGMGLVGLPGVRDLLRVPTEARMAASEESVRLGVRSAQMRAGSDDPPPF
jgi:hypothetical protein